LSYDSNFHESTLAVHGGRAPDAHAEAVVFPIFQAATFAQKEVGVTKGHSYSRVSNPTVDALEHAIGALEGTPQAVCFRTGMAAVTTMFLATLKAGDHAIISDVVYGGTVRLFVEILNGLGVSHSRVNTSDPAAVEHAINERTRIVLIETPGNPTMKLSDIAAIADIIRRHEILLAVDNTFLTPLLQRPFELGADISVLSTTKYIEEHNSTVGGSLACRDEKLASSPGYLLQHKQARGAGAVLSFTTGSSEISRRIVEATRMFSICVSFGSINSTISLPGRMSHASVPPEVGALRELPDDLVRISVGIEDAGDLIADIEQAFAASALESGSTAQENATEVA
jgi:cystathionine beta-lyase/cystathionine gamma-synthase